MPSISQSRELAMTKLQSGEWAYVPQPAAPPAIPAPSTAYPAAPNQYLRAPLPADMWEQPDGQRQFHASAIPQTRIAPLSVGTDPIAGAQAASQAIQIFNTTPAKSSGGVTSVGLTMPTPVFVSPVSGSIGTDDVRLAPAFAPELQNYVFAGPTGSNGNVTLDNITTVTAVAPSTSTVYTASVSVSAANEFVLSVVGLLGASATFPAGFTTALFGGSPARYIGSFVSTGSGTITASGVTNFVGPVIEFLAAFKSSGGAAPTIRQITAISASSGTHSTAFGSPVLANSTIIAIPFASVVGAGTAPPGNFTITDSQANTYTQLTNAYKSDATSGLAMFSQMFATPGISAGALTVSATNPSGVWGTPSVHLLEVTGLAAGSFLPTFRPLVSADIPNLSASSITSGQLALARGGTNADLSATGGTSQFLSQAGVGAAVTVVQPDYTDLQGVSAATKYKNITLVSNGLVSEVAKVDLTAQTAAITTTTLYAVPAAGVGQYRLNWNAKVTTAAGVTSTLGPLTIVYTDPDGVVQTITAAAQNSAGTIETSDGGNSTTTVMLGMPLFLNCKASTNITYAFAYASNAANAMNFNIHLKLESLG